MNVEFEFNIGDKVQFDWMGRKCVGVVRECYARVSEEGECIEYDIAVGDQWYRVAEELIDYKIGNNGQE